MPLAVDPSRKSEYVFPEDKEQERPPRFFLRTPSLRVHDSAQAQLLAVQGGKELPAAFFADVLRDCLTGWEDWKGADGVPIPFETAADGKPTEATLMRLTYADRMELALRALALAKPTEKESE